MLVKFTDIDGDTVLVEPRCVVAVWRNKEKNCRTLVVCDQGFTVKIPVHESFDYIQELVNTAEQEC